MGVYDGRQAGGEDLGLSDHRQRLRPAPGKCSNGSCFPTNGFVVVRGNPNTNPSIHQGANEKHTECWVMTVRYFEPDVRKDWAASNVPRLTRTNPTFQSPVRIL